MTQPTMRAERLHIAFFGRRNAGKSSLINALTKQDIAIVSDTPGTTTDPVYKSMELLPVGPVVLIDTAGIDDLDDQLGKERVRRTEKVLGKTDLALLLIDPTATEFAYEEHLIDRFEKAKIPYVTVLNKSDLSPTDQVRNWLANKSFVAACPVKGIGIEELKKAIIDAAPSEWEPPYIRDLIHKGDIVVLVIPIDTGAPKGRIIIPQVRAIREILDAEGIAMMCQEPELAETFRSCAKKPVLAVTDSQAFAEVAKVVPNDIPLTSFSILSIRQKGDLTGMIRGVQAVKSLKPGDKVLIAESCTHHPLEDDIGRIKIPKWLKEYVGGDLQIDLVPGYSYPDNLKDYKLVVHCGGCTLNRREVLRRQRIPEEQGIPMTNYGVLISFLRGVFPRALEPFEEARGLFGERENF